MDEVVLVVDGTLLKGSGDSYDVVLSLELFHTNVISIMFGTNGSPLWRKQF